MTESPELLPLTENQESSEPERQPNRRWQRGIVITLVLNLAMTTTALGGLGVQYLNYDVAADKAITEQMNESLDLIDNDNATIQAAGLRQLERLARDGSHGEQDFSLDIAQSYLANDRPNATEVENQYTSADNVYKVDVGTQAAIDVLRHRDTEKDRNAPGMREFALDGMVAEAADLSGVTMRKSTIRASSCKETVWNDAKLRGSDLWESGFSGAEFHDAELREVAFTGSNLQGADFTDADLTNAHLDRARFDANTNLAGADLSEATFNGADLTEVDFNEVGSIAGADFTEAIGVENNVTLSNANGHESARWSDEQPAEQ